MHKNPISRRDFVKGAAITGLGLSLNISLPSCMTQTDNPYLGNIGLQLWTLRNQLKVDPKASLQKVKEAGYVQVEPTRLNECMDLLPYIKDFGLKLESTHFNWAYITERWDLQDNPPLFKSFDHLLELAHKAGLNSLIFGYWKPEERSKLDDYKKLADQLNAAGEKCKNAGMQLGYHNHSFEFEPMDSSTGFDTLIERTEADLLKFELDVFWSSIAGIPPLEMMKKLDGRMTWLHLKDKLQGTQDVYDNGKVPEKAFQPLGKGVLDLASIIKAAPGFGVKNCIVEQDHSPEIFNDLNVSMNYLKG
ncbi:MAG: TIM barrel protein [Bacteroidia bacterium]|nr:TIM barrel protein [Bacteroidia bacterium]